MNLRLNIIERHQRSLGRGVTSSYLGFRKITSSSLCKMASRGARRETGKQFRGETMGPWTIVVVIEIVRCGQFGDIF